MNSASKTLATLFGADDDEIDPAVVCAEAFSSSAERAQCEEDFKQGRFGDVDAGCAVPWWKIFNAGSSKHVCIDRPVFMALFFMNIMTLCVAFAA